MFFPPPPPPRPRCPECERLHKSEKERYGFNIIEGYYYWTKIPEVKACCPVKVMVVEATAKTVTVTVNNKTFVKDRTDFLKSSWRDYDSF
jgi:hypothetical protein